MKLRPISIFSILLLISVILISCEDDEATLSSDNSILNFAISDGSTQIDLLINNDNSTVTGNVPFNFQLENVSTEIVVADGASISPAPNVEQDFTNPVTYTITAENGDTKSYVVELTVDPNSENLILTFSIEIAETSYEAIVNNAQNLVTATLPYLTDLSALSPVVTISDNATINPASGIVQNFTSPVTYEVTAEDGTTREYSIEIENEKSPEKEILSFGITINDDSFFASINTESRIIRDTLPYFSNLEALSPIITVSDKASINPGSGEEQDFTNPVVYEVEAENGTTQSYTVELYREKSPENDLLAFYIDEAEASNIQGIVDETLDQVTLRVPANLDLSNVIPTFEVSDRATISNDLGSGIDLTSAYILEVVAENGSTKSYTIQSEHMDITESISFESGSASKWFGGDNRTSIGPRNIGTGQSILISDNVHLQSFAVHFQRKFDFSENPEFTGHEVEINCVIRSIEGDSLTSASIINPASFNGGWVTFDFSSRSVYLESNTEYIFTWYLPDGFSDGYNSGSSGDTDMGFTDGAGYDVRIVSEGQMITDWNNWFEHGWDFWFRFEGFK